MPVTATRTEPIEEGTPVTGVLFANDDRWHPGVGRDTATFLRWDADGDAEVLFDGEPTFFQGHSVEVLQ